MKKTLLILLGFTPLLTFAQAIPNGDFEVSSNGIIPDDFFSSSNTSLSILSKNENVTIDTHAQSGTKAVKLVTREDTLIPPPIYVGLTTPAIFSSGSLIVPTFTISGMPTSLDGFYDLPNNSNGDKLTITVTISSGGTDVGVGTMSLSQTTTGYQAFSIPITYTLPGTPDKAKIEMTTDDDGNGNGTPGTEIWIDNLTFSSNPTGINANNSNTFKVYPNPSNGTFVITSNYNSTSTLVVRDITGKTIHSQIINGNNNTITLPTNIDKGLYFITISNINGTVSLKHLVK